MTVEEKKANYEILWQTESKEWTIIDRHMGIEPIVVCWYFDENTYSWASGHYFTSKDAAMKWLYTEKIK